MMVSHVGTSGILIGTAVCTLFFVPAHGSAQDSRSVSCTEVSYLSPFMDVVRCAQQGFATAQYLLGIINSAGLGVTKDEAEAVRLYRLAAEQGLAGAQVSLAIMNAHGRGVPLDYAKAMEWYLMAAEQGDATAQFNIGQLYAFGTGVPVDPVFQHMWYSISSAHGFEAAGSVNRVQRRMTPAQLAEAQRLSREWLAEHPQAGGN